MLLCVNPSGVERRGKRRMAISHFCGFVHKSVRLISQSGTVVQLGNKSPSYRPLNKSLRYRRSPGQ